MRSKAPRVIDAEFEIVQDVRGRPSGAKRFGRWLLHVAAVTTINTAFAGVVSYVGLVFLKFRFEDLRWLLIGIVVATAFGRGFLVRR